MTSWDRQYQTPQLHSRQHSCRTNIDVVKWEQTFPTLILVEFTGHKMEKKYIYYNNDKTNSRLVFSMTENFYVLIIMSCIEILTKP